MKRIMTFKAYKSSRVIKRKRDGNREFITYLAYISVIEKWILLILVYKGLNNDLRDI